MTHCCYDTLLATVVECYDTTVREWQLNLTLTLLAGNLTCYGTVYLVGQPVLTSHSLHLENTLQVLVEVICRISYIFIFTLYGLIYHHSLRSMTEHLSYIEVEWLHAVSLLEAEVSIACSLTNHVHWSTLTVGNLLNLADILLVDEQAHALLALVGDDFLGAQSLVADRQLRHVDFATALFYQLRETVQVTG